MSENSELVLRLQRVLADSEFIIKTLARTDVNKNNYKEIVYNLDSTSGCVVQGLFEVLDDIEDAIEQYDF